MPTLLLFDKFSRKDVHAIFSPDTSFAPQAGTWGLQGIVEVPNRRGDYVFFVTFGQKQGDHEFDEFITEDGVLAWQSQPSQTLDERRIRDFIRHREEANNIYLFLRTSKNLDYTYFGRLKYLDHDPVKQRPVHFQWQLLDWPPTAAVLTSLGEKLVPVQVGQPGPNEGTGTAEHHLWESPIPGLRKPGRQMPTPGNRTRARRPDYIGNQVANQELGMLGELLVLRNEQQRLMNDKRPDLAAKVRHVSVLENDTAGYDILSYQLDGQKLFIEVKTTRGPIDSDFFISASELNFARAHAAHYRLYRLYDYSDERDTAGFFVLDGAFEQDGRFCLASTNFRVSLQREGTP